MVRGSWRPNRTATYCPPLLWLSALCLSRSPGLLNRRPRGSAFCWVLAFSTTSCHQQVSKVTGGPEGPFGQEWLSLLHLISNFSGPQLIRGPKGPLHRAFSTTSYQQLLWTPTLQRLQRPPPSGFLYYLSSLTPTVWLLVLTELYNSSTPTQSLEWHVWLLSSGNNCHAVPRSLSSGASVYECTMGFFTLSHFISQIHPRDLFWLLAIGMCHFLPVHHFGMACLPGPKVKIQTPLQDLVLLWYELGSICTQKQRWAGTGGTVDFLQTTIKVFHVILVWVTLDFISSSAQPGILHFTQFKLNGDADAP